MSRTDQPRQKSLEILHSVEGGAFADALLDQARLQFDERDNAFILELVYGTLRNLALIDWKLNQVSTQPVSKTDAWTRNILRLGTYQMFFLDRVPVSAAVNTAAELAKVFGKKSGYVNGVLRNLDRKRDAIALPDSKDRVKEWSILYSHPEWLVRRWNERFGAEKTETLLRENNRPARLVLRTNTLKTNRETLKVSLLAEGAEVRETLYSPVGLELVSTPALQSLKSYQSGMFTIQDEAAQLVGMMLSPKPGERVLDACAAPGGKATHLAELMQNNGSVLALDIDKDRLRRISENSARLGTAIVRPMRGDAARFKESDFDKILIDAPCSGLGVLRRHPDGRWRKQESTSIERQRLQLGILTNSAQLLNPGGVLVYATCTTEPEENEEVIKKFLSDKTDFVIDDPKPYVSQEAAELVDENGFLHTYPNAPEMDGFFAVRMVKK